MEQYVCRMCRKEKEEKGFSVKNGVRKPYCNQCGFEHKENVFVAREEGWLFSISKEKAELAVEYGLGEMKGTKEFKPFALPLSEVKRRIRQFKQERNELEEKYGKEVKVIEKNKKTYKLFMNDAQRILNEGIAKYDGIKTIKYLYTNQQLDQMAVERNFGECFICKSEPSKGIFFKDEDAIRSITGEVLNLIENRVPIGLTCVTEMKGYLNWLNAEESFEEDSILLINDKEDLKFNVTKASVEKLIEEEMAKWTEDGAVKVMYSPYDFRLYLIKRDGKFCPYCNESEADTIDHVHPRAKGGMTTPKNCIMACKTCNNKKGDMSKEEFVELLKKSREKRFKKEATC